MDSFELNKIMGAVLGTCLFLLSLNIAASAVFAPHKPAKPGYDIVVQEKGKPGETPAAVPDEPIEKLLASADVEKGEASAKKCAACHTFDKGGPNLVGPNLYGVVGRERASAPSFNYSAAMKAKGGNWTVEDLNALPHQSEGFDPGHHDGLCRHSARQRARRRDHVSELEVRQSAAVAEGGRGAGRHQDAVGLDSLLPRGGSAARK